MCEHLVVAAGNLGAGKTALVERVGDRLGWHIVYESVIDNPYLTDFYADMSSWAFELQVYFLGHRAEQHLQSAAIESPVIMDRSIYEDANVFAKALHDMGHIDDRDYSSYLKAFDVVVRNLPSPDLLIYLKASPRVLMQRIKARGLKFDYRGISEEYLEVIAAFYEDWIDVFDICPVLTIDTEDVDYVNDSKCLDRVIGNILEAVSG